VTLGGGVEGFANSAASDSSSVGGSWNVRATYGTNTYLAFEGSYIGSAQSLDFFDNVDVQNQNATLVGNGAQAALRINFVKRYAVQPFIYGGVAWRHYDITNQDTNIVGMIDHDDVAEFPLGIGIAGHYKGFTLDARAEYRWAAYEDLALMDNNGDQASLDRWGVFGNIGYEL